MFTLTNKVALVTGGASGIGLAISQLFAQQGAYVHILELNQAQAQTVADELVQQGFQAEAHAVDVSKPVSYTHLDVYKRQLSSATSRNVWTY